MRNPDDTAWRPRIQKTVLATVDGVGPGKYVAVRDLPPATALIVVWSSPDQAHPEMAMLRGDGVAERVDRPGGGYIGFACVPADGELLVTNATDVDMEDIQVLGFARLSRSSCAIRSPCTAWASL